MNPQQPDEASSASAVDRGVRTPWWIPASLISLVLAVFLWPLMVGGRSLFFRDVANFHWPVKVGQLQAWAEGSLPFLDLWRAGGQAGLGNLNTLAFYPSNLLLLAPGIEGTAWGFNAHFWLHLLVAPLTFYCMARVLGLRQEGAWVGAVLYSSGGFAISLLAFYNLIAVLPLIPLLIAASLTAAFGPAADGGQGPSASSLPTRGRRLGAAVVVVGLVWCLLLLAGDPLSAAMALGATILTMAIFRRSCERRGVLRVGFSLVAGTLLAWPQIVEFWLTLEGSVRATLGFSGAGVLRGSFHPAMIWDQLLPFVLGAPTPLFWGQRFHGGAQPLFYTFSPGALALILVALAVWNARRGRGRTFWLGCLLCGLGLFFALGEFNPLVVLVSKLTDASWLRFPTKFWWWVALGVGILGGRAFDDLWSARTGRRENSAQDRSLKRVRWLAVALGLVCLGVAFAAGSGLAAGSYEGVISGDETPTTATSERALAEALPRLLMAGAIGASMCLAIWGVGAGRLGRRGWLWLVLFHAATQMVLLAPLYPTIDVEDLVRTPAILEGLGAEAVIVHGSVGGGFAADAPSTPDPPSLASLQLEALAAAYPASGVAAGYRYHLNSSPEGLDSFLPGLLGQVLRSVPDEGKVRLLEALGATHLVTERRVLDDRLVLEREADLGEAPLFRYRVQDAARILVAEQWIETQRPQQAVRAILDPDFDPRLMLAIASESTGLKEEVADGTAGESSSLVQDAMQWSILEETAHRVRLQIETERPSVVAFDRAFLPRYRATINGEKVPTTVANLVRLAVRVPSGRHELVVEFDRSGWVSSVAVSALGMLLLVLLAMRARSG